MSVIIRLQNLPWSANALDIRQFFRGLSIPEGGVHIVGGELGDAFIAFSTDEDARQAFNLTGGKIKEIQVKLMLSSRTEMQKVIEAARNPLAAFMQHTPTGQPLAAILPAAVPPLIGDLKKDDDNKRDRRRSRSRSRDRKDRSRERRDRRRRDRSRSRSRDRRDRRRRERSSSRERRSKDRERRSNDRRRSEDKTGFSSNSNSGFSDKEHNPKVWEDPIGNKQPSILQQQALLHPFLANTLEEARKNLNALGPNQIPVKNRNGFPNQKDGFGPNRNRGDAPWNAAMPGMRPGDGRPNFAPRLDRNGPGNNDNNTFGMPDPRQIHNQFGDNPRMGYNRPLRADGRNTRFDNNESDRLMPNCPSLLDLPHPDNSHNCCVSLRSYYGGYGEIRRFFQGIFIHSTGIKFINDESGRRTGIVYIRFATPDGKVQALQRNGAILKHAPVEVTHLDDNIFDVTIDRYRPDYNSESNDRHSPAEQTFSNKNSPNVPKITTPPTHFSCIAIEDLPLFTKEQDMLKIFSDYSMINMWLVNKQRHIIAYIKFANPDDAKKVASETGKFIFDGKPLEIRPCSDDEYASVSQDEIQIIDDDDDEEEKEMDEEKVYISSECVSLSGLPLKTNDRDISDFFSDVAIVPGKIHLVTSNVGFTGQAFCEFSSPADAEIALEKNGLPLGSGTVVVESVSRSEMEVALGRGPRQMNPNNLNLNPNQRPPPFPRGYGFPPRGGPMGPRPLFRRNLLPPVNPSDLASSGCTLLMENVPYKSGLNEILEFFDGFDVSPDNVLRRFNENGTPSGEAKVIFSSSADAFQALQERHHGQIRDRTIFLSQC